LEEGKIILDLGVKPRPITELEFYGGNGEKFLLAYFKFALENAVLGYVGAKAVDAVEALYYAAKARRAGKAAIEMLEAAKKAEGVCFAAGTKVATAEGGKPIEELKEGDEVLSYDPGCGETAWQRVTRVYRRTATEVLDITVEGVQITCTPEHPFWVEADGWTAAKDLKPGTQLLNKDGRTIRVQSILRRVGSFIAYNIEVEHFTATMSRRSVFLSIISASRLDHFRSRILGSVRELIRLWMTLPLA
jgi:hypothetical protein